jgi:hypothetical protein
MPRVSRARGRYSSCKKFRYFRSVGAAAGATFGSTASIWRMTHYDGLWHRIAGAKATVEISDLGNGESLHGSYIVGGFKVAQIRLPPADMTDIP